MPWNPEIYNQFKEIRFKPFFDLMALIAEENLQDCIDIGCGTGEQTAILAEKFKDSNFLGIDSSKEMLSQTKKHENERLKFSFTAIEEFAGSESNWDLIFSNAALQWSDNHWDLFPKLISKLNNRGQFAVQMPFQKENSLNKILLEMVSEKSFVDVLKGFSRNSPLLQIDDYAKIMFDAGLKNIAISLKVYPLIAKSETELYDFISGSSLIPYIEQLHEDEQKWFKAEYIKRIINHFVSFPTIYSFKRILLYGIKS